MIPHSSPRFGGRTISRKLKFVAAIASVASASRRLQVAPPSLFVIGARVVAALGQRPRPGEYLPAIREGDRCAKRKMGTVPGTIALDRDHISGLHRILSPALPVEHVRRAALKRPVHHLAVLAFHI